MRGKSTASARRATAGYKKHCDRNQQIRPIQPSQCVPGLLEINLFKENRQTSQPDEDAHNRPTGRGTYVPKRRSTFCGCVSAITSISEESSWN